MSDREVDLTSRLRSKVVLVVGATSGIGRAISLRLAAEGAVVLAAGRRTDLGENLAADIAADGGQALFVTCDATVEDDVATAVQAATARFGRLDGAVNNAGGPVVRCDVLSCQVR